MTTIIQCDRCGKQAFRKIHISRLKPDHNPDGWVDLCAVCLDQLSRWIANGGFVDTRVEEPSWPAKR